MDAPMAHPIVALVCDAIVGTTGGSLVGLYLYGSFATGDLEAHVSDLDLIAVLDGVPDDSLVSRLTEMHENDDDREDQPGRAAASRRGGPRLPPRLVSGTP